MYISPKEFAQLVQQETIDALEPTIDKSVKQFNYV